RSMQKKKAAKIIAAAAAVKQIQSNLHSPTTVTDRESSSESPT
ncbi:unnamed protein product, partial [Didymodactylos carnosus]